MLKSTVNFISTTVLQVALSCIVTPAILSLVGPACARADDPPSLHQAHPLAWMHGLPTGEQPGWSSPNWINFETSEDNVWNAPMTMTDNRNGQIYYYEQDYEQTSAILEVGHAFANWLGVSVIAPYANRWGGYMDHFLNAYHIFIHNNLYERDQFPQWQTIDKIETDGANYVDSHPLQDVSNIELKLKFWLLKWLGKEKDSCPCGISLGSQTKLPVQSSIYGGTTGHVDQSAMIYIGIPLFSASAFWFTGAVTWLGDNPAIENWPRYNHAYMYEGSFDFAINDRWGALFMVRADSPFLKADDLTFTDVGTPTQQAEDQFSSGWNSLVHWRGTEAGGLRYRTSGGTQFQMLAIEDFGIGPYDAIDGFYKCNAPDFSFSLQLHTGF